LAAKWAGIGGEGCQRRRFGRYRLPRLCALSFLYSRSLALLAGGKFTGSPEGEVVIEVAAKLGDPDWGIVQSPFMRDNAKTIAFEHKLVVNGDSLTYEETTTVDIYGKVFAHTDGNRLRRVG
jgi:hypothetical protein